MSQVGRQAKGVGMYEIPPTQDEHGNLIVPVIPASYVVAIIAGAVIGFLMFLMLGAITGMPSAIREGIAIGTAIIAIIVGMGLAIRRQFKKGS